MRLHGKKTSRYPKIQTARLYDKSLLPEVIPCLDQISFRHFQATVIFNYHFHKLHEFSCISMYNKNDTNFDAPDVHFDQLSVFSDAKVEKVRNPKKKIIN
jgi:hypothetical protein